MSSRVRAPKRRCTPCATWPTAPYRSGATASAPRRSSRGARRRWGQAAGIHGCSGQQTASPTRSWASTFSIASRACSCSRSHSRRSRRTVFLNGAAFVQQGIVMLPRLRRTISLQKPSRRTIGLLGGLLLLATTIACGAGSAANGTPSAMDTMSGTVPRWVCPSATPLPPIEVEDGTRPNDLGTPEPQYRDTDPYEREYGIGNRPPPRPTPYSKGAGFQATNAFFLNQIVNWQSLDLRISISRTQPHPADATRRIYYGHLEWNNRGTPFSFEPARQIALTAIGTSGGRMTAGDWRFSAEAQQLSGLSGDQMMNLTVAAGRSEMDVPIIAPYGEVKSVDLQLDQVGTTTGNDLRLHFTPGRAPECGFDGTWDAAYNNPYKAFSGVAAPPGASVLVATALKYVGRQYCWAVTATSPATDTAAARHK